MESVEMDVIINSFRVCRMQFETEGELVQHRKEFIIARTRCKCKMRLTGNQIVDAKHFKACSSKRKTTSVLQTRK